MNNADTLCTFCQARIVPPASVEWDDRVFCCRACRDDWINGAKIIPPLAPPAATTNPGPAPARQWPQRTNP